MTKALNMVESQNGGMVADFRHLVSDYDYDEKGKTRNGTIIINLIQSLSTAEFVQG